MPADRVLAIDDDEAEAVSRRDSASGDGIKMVDSQRLRTTPDGIRLVSEVAAVLAERGEGQTSVLSATTYFPIDVDSVARVFEGLEELQGIERVEKGPITVYEIDNVERFISGGPDIGDDAFIDESAGLLRAIGSLKTDKEWVRKVREQHELLRIVADAADSTLDLRYLTSRASMPRARIQSLLNDFDAAGYIEVVPDEEVEQLRYTFPDVDYPKDRFEHNMRLLEDVELPTGSRISAWIFLTIFAVIVLVVVILLRF